MSYILKVTYEIYMNAFYCGIFRSIGEHSMDGGKWISYISSEFNIILLIQANRSLKKAFPLWSGIEWAAFVAWPNYILPSYLNILHLENQSNTQPVKRENGY